MTWADEAALAALRSAGTVPERALGLYAHIVAAERNWLMRLEGPPDATQPGVFPALSLDECETLGRANHARYEALVRGPEAVDLDRVVAYRNLAGEPQQRRLEDILLHVALHGAYHRGQVAQLLRAAGETPATTDYIRWSAGHAS